jgi:hypothetical protein
MTSMAITSRVSERGAERRDGSVWPSAPVAVFLVGLVVPWAVKIGSFGITLPRLVLLVFLLPSLIKLARGEAGPINIVDVLVLLLCGWICLSLSVVAGWSTGLESGGIIALETAGSYFLARGFIRNADDFRAVVRVLFICIVAILPFAIFEAVTGNNLLMSLFAMVLPTVPMSHDGLRWGLKRVQSVYEHPILFGVCTGSTLALVSLVLGDGIGAARRSACALLVVSAAFLSMSSGAFAVMAFQIGLVGWAKATARIPHNWAIFGGFVAATFVVIEVGSSQSVPQFYISHFSLDRETAWLRLLIWEFGSASVMAHPIFGIGFSSWVRPHWLSDSIDMFWMAEAIRHGIPGGMLIMSLPFATLAIVARARLPHARSSAYRVAYLIVITSFFLAGWTVHFWGATYLLFLFLLGCGGWLVSPALGPTPTAAPLPPYATLRGGTAVAHLSKWRIP